MQAVYHEFARMVDEQSVVCESNRALSRWDNAYGARCLRSYLQYAQSVC